jgi:lipoyl(octanoyl) transferase
MTDSSAVCRLYLDASAAGAWNMAVDQTLLDLTGEDQATRLRFYQWSEPTISLGYFQAYAERANHAASRQCAVVRRSTGGGAIVHDHELTYSLAVPAALSLADDSSWLYGLVHDALLETLLALGIACEIRGKVAPVARALEPFLCFQRRAAGDVVFNGEKICGSAQRRRPAALLQHGSLLLASSPAAPELPGLAELTGRKFKAAAVANAWAAQIVRRLGLTAVPARLSSSELNRVRTLALEWYDCAKWTGRR